MALDLIDLGSVADDRTGDTFRAGGTKINAQFTELFAFKDAQPDVIVTQESDFPVQDATTITLESKKIYRYTADITTAKRFVCEDGSLLTAGNLEGYVLTYTGTGSMFTGVDANWTLAEATVSCPNAIAFNFSDTVGGQSIVRILAVTVNSCAQAMDLNDIRTIVTRDLAFESATQGIEVAGASWLAFNMSTTAIISTSATFKGLNLQSATVPNLELSNLILIGPSGAFGISGLASSGNIPTGSLAMVNNCSFSGGLTALQNITTSDIRWKFTDNAGVPDTVIDGLLSLNSNATATTTVLNTPALVAGTWVVERTSLFTGTTAGRLTYIGERDIVVPVDITATVEAVSGTNKDIEIYLAKNGTVIANSGKTNTVGAGSPANTSVVWQVKMSTNNYLEVYIENQTDSVNMIVKDAILRAR